MKNIRILILASIFLVINPNTCFSSIKKRNLWITLSRVDTINYPTFTIGFSEGDSMIVVNRLFRKEEKYLVKIYYVHNEKDTLFPSRLELPYLFYNTSEKKIKANLILSSLSYKAEHAKYRIVFDFYNRGKLVSRYISRRKVKL